MTKLYVANLPYHATEDILRHIFEHAGAVRSATIIKDPQTGQSRGFGFVEMETERAAREAIAQFNGDTYDGRVVKVEPSKRSATRVESRDREPQPKVSATFKPSE